MDKKQQDKFKQLIAIASFTKLVDLFISAKTTLPWLLTSLGTPTWIISLLVPIRESGSLLPQWVIKQKTQHIEDRVKLWRWGIITQTIAIGFMFITALLTQSLAAGLLTLFALLVLSLGRSLTSLSMKDIQGINTKKGNRGKLVGIASSVSGLLSLLVAGIMILFSQGEEDFTAIILIGSSVVLMFVSLGLSKNVTAKLSYQGGTKKQQAGIWSTIRQQHALKHLIISRCLLMHGALIAPFFVATSAIDSDVFQLPCFIIASASASFLSSYLWGHLADSSAVKTLFYATTVCIFASIAFYFLAEFKVWQLDVMMFFVLNLGYAGVRTGRKTYMLDIADGSQRTKYVAAANTVVGIILLLVGGLYALLNLWIGEYIILVMTSALALGLIHTVKMKAEK